MAITRTAMVDDDGSGTTGTIFNNAWKTALYDQIDAAIANIPPAGVAAGSALVSNGVGAPPVYSATPTLTGLGIGTAPTWPFIVGGTFTAVSALVLGANDYTAFAVATSHAGTAGMGMASAYQGAIASGTQSDFAPQVIFDTGGAGAVTRQAGILIRNLVKGTNNTYLLLGTDTIPSANYGIYAATANPNFLAGILSIGATPAASGDLRLSTGGLSSGGANGQVISVLQQLTELTTIAAAATTDTVIQMPANAVILGVSVRVTTVIPTAATFTVGDSGSAARFSTAAVSTAANSTDPGTKAGAYYNAAALAIRITPNLTPAANTGRVRVTIYYYTITPPTS